VNIFPRSYFNKNYLNREFIYSKIQNGKSRYKIIDLSSNFLEVNTFENSSANQPLFFQNELQQNVQIQENNIQAFAFGADLNNHQGNNFQTGKVIP